MLFPGLEEFEGMGVTSFRCPLFSLPQPLWEDRPIVQEQRKGVSLACLGSIYHSPSTKSFRDRPIVQEQRKGVSLALMRGSLYHSHSTNSFRDRPRPAI